MLRPVPKNNPSVLAYFLMLNVVAIAIFVSPPPVSAQTHLPLQRILQVDTEEPKMGPPLHGATPVPVDGVDSQPKKEGNTTSTTTNPPPGVALNAHPYENIPDNIVMTYVKFRPTSLITLMRDWAVIEADQSKMASIRACNMDGYAQAVDPPREDKPFLETWWVSTLDLLTSPECNPETIAQRVFGDVLIYQGGWIITNFDESVFNLCVAGNKAVCGTYEQPPNGDMMRENCPACTSPELESMEALVI